MNEQQEQLLRDIHQAIHGNAAPGLKSRVALLEAYVKAIWALGLATVALVANAIIAWIGG